MNFCCKGMGGIRTPIWTQERYLGNRHGNEFLCSLFIPACGKIQRRPERSLYDVPNPFANREFELPVSHASVSTSLILLETRSEGRMLGNASLRSENSGGSSSSSSNLFEDLSEIPTDHFNRSSRAFTTFTEYSMKEILVSEIVDKNI